MKIVCESCGTKYSIADEKVSGKVFKLRCKKCSHVIVVKGNGESEAAPQETPAPAAVAPAPEPEPAAPAGSPDAVWHLVIDREQVGPMTADEVRAKFAAGQIDAESYVWREGFDDWLKLATVEIFQDLASAPPRSNGEDQATRRSDSNDIFRQNSAEEEPSPAADLFGGGAAASISGGGMTASPNAATIMASGPVPAPFSASNSGRSSSSAPAAEAGPGGSVEVKSMTGARSENSVLFSLNNLQALATGGGGAAAPAPSAGPKPGYASSQTEGSGLIDIRAMAAQTLSANSFSVGTASKPDELPMVNEAPLFSPVAPAVLMPISEPSGMPKWVWAVVGVGGVALVGMIAVIVWVLRAPPPVAQPTPPTPAGGPVASSGGTPEAPKPNPQPSAAQPAAPAAAAAGADNGSKAPAKDDTAAGADEKKRRSKEKGDKADKGDKVAAKGQGPKEAAAPAPAPTPAPAAEPPKKVKPNKPKDDLDDLLDSATGGASGGKPKGESSKKDAPEQLSMDVIKSGLKSVQGSVNGCGPGTYSVKLTIGRNGRVTDASVPGKAGDSAADCVVRAVKGARFPEFTGDPQTLTYPFIVR